MKFRLFLLATMAMGTYFLVGQAIEWNGLDFGFTTGVFGGTFYLLTGFHGLHVFTGISVAVDYFGTFFHPWQLRHRTLRRERDFVVLALRRCYLDYFVYPHLRLAVNENEGEITPSVHSIQLMIATHPWVKTRLIASLQMVYLSHSFCKWVLD